jgi:hypothetical protein
VKPIRLFKVAFFFKRCLRLQNFYLTENFLPEREMAFYKNAVAASQKSKRRLVIGPFNFVLKTVNWKTT